jgi:hypothetical protein
MAPSSYTYIATSSNEVSYRKELLVEVTQL